MHRPENINGVPVPYEATVAQLLHLIRCEDNRAWAAFTALGHKGTARALQALRRLITHPDWRYRRSAIEALAAHPDGTQAADEICSAFHDTSPYVVRTACIAAAELGIVEAHDLVAALLNSTSGDTRQTAIHALSDLWQASDFDDVLIMFTSDPAKEVRKAAAWVLYEHVTWGTWEILFELWISDPLPRHRVWACELFQRFPYAVYRERVAQLAKDPNGHVRKAVNRALGTH